MGSEDNASAMCVPTAQATSVRVGCCGFALGRSEYFRRFPLVEVQQTFYDPPRPQTLQRWRQQAPPGFEFTLKAWQLITHEPSSPTYRRLRRPLDAAALQRYGGFRPTAEVMAAWQTTLEAARCLAARVIVFQCPASLTPTDRHIEDLRRFFVAIRPEAQGLILAWEPRGPWPEALTHALCTELGLVQVVDPFRQTPPRQGLSYFRLHGIGGYRYRYTDADLDRLLGMCRGQCYCLFNNLAMAQDAERFLALVHRGR